MIQTFKIYNSMDFDIFTELIKHNHVQYLNVFITQKENHIAMSNVTLFPISLPLAVDKYNSTFCLYRLAYSEYFI